MLDKMMIHLFSNKKNEMAVEWSITYTKTCLKRPLKNSQNKGLNGKW